MYIKKNIMEIKKFEEFVNESSYDKKFGHSDEPDEIIEYSKFFEEDLKEKINDKSLEDVLNYILKYIEHCLTPVTRRINRDNNLGDKFIRMTYNINKLYISANPKTKIRDNSEYKEEWEKIREFHLKIVKGYLGIEDVFASADKKNENIVKPFYRYLMYVDTIYRIWDEFETRYE